MLEWILTAWVWCGGREGNMRRNGKGIALPPLSILFTTTRACSKHHLKFSTHHAPLLILCPPSRSASRFKSQSPAGSPSLVPLAFRPARIQDQRRSAAAMDEPAHELFIMSTSSRQRAPLSDSAGSLFLRG